MKFLKLLSVILAGFWVVACVHTRSSQVPKPQQPKPQKTQTESSKSQQAPEESPSSQTTAQEAARDRQQQASEATPSGQASTQDAAKSQQQQAADKSPSGQESAQEAAQSQQQQASEKSPSGQPASEQAAKDAQTQIAKKIDSGQTAAGSQSTSGQKSAASGRPAATGTADAKLEEARRNLRISEATEKRIAAELEQLKKSGTASPETIRNYETYHESVKEMVAENRKIVEQMEATKARFASETATSAATPGSKSGDTVNSQMPEEPTADRVAALDRQLDASLNQFDARLLKEMDDIRDESAEKMRDLAREAAEAARRLREEGMAAGTAESESSEATGEAAAQRDETTQAEQGAEGSKTASTDSSRPEGRGGGGAEQDQARYEDDDIVARQLREAAENETDPELKEKLWKEYYEYKKSQR